MGEVGNSGCVLFACGVWVGLIGYWITEDGVLFMLKLIDGKVGSKGGFELVVTNTTEDVKVHSRLGADDALFLYALLYRFRRNGPIAGKVSGKDIQGMLRNAVEGLEGGKLDKLRLEVASALMSEVDARLFLRKYLGDYGVDEYHCVDTIEVYHYKGKTMDLSESYLGEVSAMEVL